MRRSPILGSFIVLAILMCTLAARGAEPISHWPFNGDLTDKIGALDGTFNGGTPNYVNGLIAQGLALDGIDDSVSIAYANPQAYTISAWVNPARVEAMNIITHTSASGPTTHWSHQMRMTVGGVFEHYLYDGAAKAVAGTTQIEVDTWYHVAVTAEHDGNMRLYVNGQEEGNAAAVATMWGAGSVFLVGSDSGNAMNWFQGVIDDLRIYDVIVPAEEIMPSLGTASRPSPEDGALDVLRDGVLSWAPNESAATRHVYFGTSFEEVDAATAPTLSDLDANSFDPGRLDFGQTYYWRVDEVNGTPDKTVFKGNVWSFTAEPYSIQIPGDSIVVSASSSSNEFSEPNKTIDGSGLGADGTHAIDPETMWFTGAVDLDPWIQYEFATVEKLDVMNIWNSNGSAESAIGWGVKDLEIQYSTDGENWDILADATQFSRAPGLPTYDQYDEIDFKGAAARYVRLNIQSNWGGILMSYGLSEVQFFMIPAAARTPEPGDGSTAILPNATITWRAGREAGEHTLYVSTDVNAVTEGSAPATTVSTNAVDLSTLNLQLGQTYYWRVDEVNAAEAVSVWPGPVWSFSTVPAWMVDDFERYNNLSPDRPFQTWLDGFGYSADEFFPVGYGGNGTGSGVGHDIWGLSSPYYNGDIMETVITIPGSAQSMPLYYANTGGVASETERQFSEPQDWTVNGIETLVINLYGAADNTGQLYVKINGARVSAPPDIVDIARAGWQQWPIVPSSEGTALDNVTSLAIGVDGASASGLLYIDDIALYPGVVEYVTPAEPDPANLLGHYSFDGHVNDSSGNSLNGEEMGGPTYTDGLDGQAIQLDGIDDYVNIVADIPEDGGTISFWIKTTNPDCGLYSIVQNLLGGGGNDRNIYITEGHIAARIWSDEVIVGAGLDIADGQWHHVVHTFGAAAGGQHLYVDGLRQASGSKGQSDFDWQERIHIGWTSDAGNPFMDGMIDNARIYGTPLSPAEIAWLAGQTEPMVKPF